MLSFKRGQQPSYSNFLKNTKKFKYRVQAPPWFKIQRPFFQAKKSSAACSSSSAGKKSRGRTDRPTPTRSWVQRREKCWKNENRFIFWAGKSLKFRKKNLFLVFFTLKIDVTCGETGNGHEICWSIKGAKMRSKIEIEIHAAMHDCIASATTASLQHTTKHISKDRRNSITKASRYLLHHTVTISWDTSYVFVPWTDAPLNGRKAYVTGRTALIINTRHAACAFPTSWAPTSWSQSCRWKILQRILRLPTSVQHWRASCWYPT